MKARTILGAMTVVAMTASAATYTDPDTGVVWTYVINSDTTTDGSTAITLGGGSTTTTAIPKQTNLDAANILWKFTDNNINYTVTRINAHAFNGCSGLTGTLTIPDTVIDLGRGQAFRGTGLTHVASVGSAEALAWGCFYSCTSLTGVFRLGNQVSMPDYQFGYCTSLSAIFAPGPDTGTTSINVKDLCQNASVLKVVYVGPNVEMANSISADTQKALRNVTGCKVFVPTSGGWLNFPTVDGGNNTDIIYYGADTNLNLVVDEDAKTITATPTDEAALLKMLEVAPMLKEVLGFDTVISINSDIDATVEITEEMLTNVKVEVPTWYLTFAVKTQAQLNRVLAVTTGPIVADITGATQEITPPVGRRVAILAPGGAIFNYHKRGLIIQFR